MYDKIPTIQTGIPVKHEELTAEQRNLQQYKELQQAFLYLAEQTRRLEDPKGKVETSHRKFNHLHGQFKRRILQGENLASRCSFDETEGKFIFAQHMLQDTIHVMKMIAMLIPMKNLNDQEIFARIRFVEEGLTKNKGQYEDFSRETLRAVEWKIVKAYADTSSTITQQMDQSIADIRSLKVHVTEAAEEIAQIQIEWKEATNRLIAWKDAQKKP